MAETSMTHGARWNRRPIALLLVLAISVAACGASTSGSGGSDANGCDQWCGNGSATVTVGGTTQTISGGGCVDGGLAGIDARFGDWRSVNGLSSYLMLIAYPPGSPTPTPGPTLAPDAAPTGPASPSVIGSSNGQPFALGPGTVVTIAANGTGSFSGTDVNGYGPVAGSFSCH